MSVFGQKIKYSITSLNFTKLLNKLNNEEISIFDVKYGDGRVSFCSNLRVKNKILAILQQSLYNDIRIETYSYETILKKRKYLLIGIVLFLCVAYLPSFFVFDLKVKCDDLLVLDKINKELIEYKNDNLILKKDIDVENIKQKVFNIDNVSFCEVTIKGGTLYVFAKAKLEPDVVEMKSQIRAKKSGKVTRIIVTSGSAVVKIGDVIKVGDLLIDGKITVDGVDGEIKTYACGKVFANDVFETVEIVENELSKNTIENMTQRHLIETKDCVVFNQTLDVKELGDKSQVTMRTEFEKVISEG
ncbi:MAG: sporulation protein YqfD [Clostridia bacterium]